MPPASPRPPCATPASCGPWAMAGNVSRRWRKVNDAVIRLQTRASRAAGLIHAVSKALRVGLQVAIYAVGAYLTVQQPDHGRGDDRRFHHHGAGACAHRSGHGHLQAVHRGPCRLQAPQCNPGRSHDAQQYAPAGPRGEIAVENLFFAVGQRQVIRGMSFRMLAGQTLAIIGPSAAGKSTFCKLLLNIWQPTAGKVRIDGADIMNWTRNGSAPSSLSAAGRGTLCRDCGRKYRPHGRCGFRGPSSRSARQAGVHEMILRLPRGYDTQIGEQGAALSGGQRQRIGLAVPFTANHALWCWMNPTPTSMMRAKPPVPCHPEPQTAGKHRGAGDAPAGHPFPCRQYSRHAGRSHSPVRQSPEGPCNSCRSQCPDGGGPPGRRFRRPVGRSAVSGYGRRGRGGASWLGNLSKRRFAFWKPPPSGPSPMRSPVKARAMRWKTPTASSGRAGLCIILIFFGGMGLWAVFGHISGAVVAPGKIKSSPNARPSNIWKAASWRIFSCVKGSPSARDRRSSRCNPYRWTPLPPCYSSSWCPAGGPGARRRGKGPRAVARLVRRAAEHG